jgi:hypothetical protein
MTEGEWVFDAANLFLWVNFFLMSQGYTRIVGAMVMVGDGCDNPKLEGCGS